jgi:endonuclease/exonuclease/phosphatase family metal-dependent hydrolase
MRVLGVLAVACAACSSSSEVARPAPLRVEAFIFTIGPLADSGTPFAAERSASLPAELRRSAADVLCLNGLYDDALRSSVIAQTASTFPFAVDLQTDEATEVTDATTASGSTPPPPTAPACAGADVARLDDALACFAQSCAVDGKLTRATCLYYGGCASAHNGLDAASLDCHACMHNTLEQSGYTIAETRARCTAPSTGVPLARRGRHGTLLLSRLPLTRPERFVLPASEKRQVVLAAAAALPAGGSLDVYCLQTSWAPARPNAKDRYRGAYGDGDPSAGWGREVELQLRKTVAFVARRSGQAPAVVMGDLNAGPGVEEDGVSVLLPYNASALLPFSTAFVEAVPPSFRPFCTTCIALNPSVGEERTDWTSHIFLSGMSPSVVRTSYRTFIGEIVRTDDATRPRVPLSAQFGIRAELEIGR